jgi:signal transduction histidine kinase/CheY-like chemotaxis protein
VIRSLINPADPPERQHKKLLQIVEALMGRVEQATDASGAAYGQFERAALLEDQVKQRTAELEHALDLLNQSNGLLAQATREAEAAQKNLANAIETVQEGFALFDVDGALVMCNSRFGMHTSDIHPALKPGLHFTEYVELVSRSRHLELPAGETPAAWAERRMRRHADRHVIFIVQMDQDRWIQVSEHRTRDGGTVILQTDVTDIIRLERQERGKLLDDQARIVRATLDHISQGVCIFDAEGRLVGWNRMLSELLAIPISRLRIGLSLGSLLGNSSDLFSLDSSIGIGDLTRWVDQPQARKPLTFEVGRANGLVLAVFAQEMPGRGFVMSFSDITAERAAVRAISEAKETLEQRVNDRTVELAEALDHAERANATRARFVAAASHDLLQPLSAAKLFLASISDEVLADKARTTLEKAQNALTSVEGILDALLDISKLESGKAAVEITSVNLGKILAQLQDEFAPLAARKGIRLDIVSSSAIVESDTTYLRRILQNLIGNAVRYTVSGRVLVGARRVAGAVRVDVIDTGPGIPLAEQKNIFREFHRLGNKASASEGVGLGLAIVERACLLLKHPLDLSSEPGKGARFSVTLPFARAAQLPDATMGQRALRDGVVPSERIVLLVENDTELRLATCLVLEKWRFNVIDVETAEEALTLLDEIGIVPDKFLIDYQLGDGMDGVGLVEALRAKYGEIDALIITANRSPAVRKRCADSAVRIALKPINALELATFLSE